jgi:membrane protease subunit (stomatin/prohibitin family)
MFIVLAIALSAAALIAVAYPIIVKSRATQPAASTTEETLAELLARRDAAFQALRDLSFDHRVGKITAEDFVAFEASLKQGAAEALAALDAWEGGADRALERSVEAEIAARRAALSRGGRPCPKCGRPATAEDKFCAACGASLPAAPPAAPICPNCGRPFEADDRFCAGCGQALPQTHA